MPSSDGPLISCSVKEFVQEVAARSSAPGGGSVSALIAAMVKMSAPIFTTNYILRDRRIFSPVKLIVCWIVSHFTYTPNIALNVLATTKKCVILEATI